MISMNRNQMVDSQPLSDLIAGVIYEIPYPDSQSEPIREGKTSDYPPLQYWEQGFGG